jgi:serine/threonine protein kinase
MCFLNLYHCCWNHKQVLKIDLPNIHETPIKYDMRTRNTPYLSPEQSKIGKELAEIAQIHNGKIDTLSADVNELFATNAQKITEHCDIYSIGAILYSLLLGEPPSHEVS